MASKHPDHEIQFLAHPELPDVMQMDRSFIQYPRTFQQQDAMEFMRSGRIFRDLVEEAVPREDRVNEPLRDHEAFRSNYAASIRTFIHNIDTSPTKLRSHQAPIFEDIANFFENTDSLDGYVEAPTGSGKTVIFSLLCQALLEGAPDPEHKPRILIVAPTRLLVRQTIAKGFDVYAPGVATTTLYSESDDRYFIEPHLLDADVTVTTYSTFRKMDDEEEKTRLKYTAQRRKLTHREYSSATEREEVVSPASTTTHMYSPTTGRKLIELYDLIILDESHNSSEISERLLDDAKSTGKTVLRFSASETQGVRSNPHSTEISKLTLTDAMEQEVISPLTSITLDPEWIGTRRMIDQLTSTGEYSPAVRAPRIIGDVRRNQLITDVAAILIRHGMTPIIAAQPGQDQSHAMMLIDQLADHTVYGETFSATRPASGVCITSNNKDIIDGKVTKSDKSPQRKIKDFEAGEGDAISGINILNEGFDSNRVDGIIAGRDTRAEVLARQRLGRTLRIRPDSEPKLAVAIEIKSNSNLPPITVADVFYEERDGKPIELGEIIGLSTEHPHYEVLKNRLGFLIEELGELCTLAEETLPQYSISLAHLKTLPVAEKESQVETTSTWRRHHVMRNNAGELERQPVLVLDQPKGYRSYSKTIISNAYIAVLNAQQSTQVDMAEVKTSHTATQSIFVAPERPLREATRTLPVFDAGVALRIDNDPDNAWISSAGIKKMLGEQIRGLTMEDIEIEMEHFIRTPDKNGNTPTAKLGLERRVYESHPDHMKAVRLLINVKDVKALALQILQSR